MEIDVIDKLSPVQVISKSVNMLKIFKEKYEDGIMALHNIQSNEEIKEIKAELSIAMDHLFDGLKRLSELQNFLKKHSSEKGLRNSFTGDLKEETPLFGPELVKIEFPDSSETKIDSYDDDNKISNSQKSQMKMFDFTDQNYQTQEETPSTATNGPDTKNKDFVEDDDLENLEVLPSDFDFDNSHHHQASSLSNTGDVIKSQPGETGKDMFKEDSDLFNLDAAADFKEEQDTGPTNDDNNIDSSHELPPDSKDDLNDYKPPKKRKLPNKTAANTKNKKSDLTCVKCNKVFAKKYRLVRHLQTHATDKKYKCPSCKKGFKDRTFLKDHILEHYVDDPFRCNMCEKAFRNKTNLNKHKKEEHIEEKEDFGFIVKRQYECKLCIKGYDTLQSFREHINACALQHLSLDLTHDTDDPSANAKPMCDQCGKEFSTKEILAQHVLIHGDYNFTCQECGKKFKKKKLFNRHVKNHKGERPYKCDQCPRDYLDMKSLKDHQVIHQGEKNYKCEICEKEFFYAQSLKYHMRSHSGEKPYTCEFCGKAFTQKSNLKDHMKVHTGEKPFKCEICGKDFARKNDLGHHQKTHTGEKPFKCTECGMTFSRAGRLNAHMRSHTGERPFKCDVCNKAFREKSGLNRHLMIHSGSRPHKCDVCGLGFIQSGALNSHKKSQHSKDAINTNSMPLSLKGLDML